MFLSVKQFSAQLRDSLRTHTNGCSVFSTHAHNVQAISAADAGTSFHQNSVPGCSCASTVSHIYAITRVQNTGMFIKINIMLIISSNQYRNIRPNKKNVCFRLPTVPKFRSPTQIILLLLLGFFTIDSSHRQIFSFQVYFCCNLN